MLLLLASGVPRPIFLSTHSTLYRNLELKSTQLFSHPMAALLMLAPTKACLNAHCAHQLKFHFFLYGDLSRRISGSTTLLTQLLCVHSVYTMMLLFSLLSIVREEQRYWGDDSVVAFLSLNNDPLSILPFSCAPNRQEILGNIGNIAY